MPSHLPSSQLLNLYAALAASDHAIIRCTQKVGLFEAVCKSLIAPGGMQLAWIGMRDDGDQRLWPQAHATQNWSYLEWVQLIDRVTQTPGVGLACTAAATNQPQWSNHLGDDPVVGTLAQAKHCQAGMALPLTLHGQPVGVLCVYCHDNFGHDDKSRGLLVQLADNLSVALETLARNQQREESEYALQESEVRYNALFASNCMPMVVVDPDTTRIVDANIRATNFYGWDYATLTSKYVSEINVLSAEVIRAEMASAVRLQRSYFNFTHRLANGELRDVEVFSSPVSFKGHTYLISAIHDVTQRRQLEARVRQSQSLMQHFIDQLPGTAFVKDSELRLIMANQQLGNLLGLDPQTLIGKTAHDIFPKDFADTVTALDHEVLDANVSRTFDETYNDRHNETSMFVIHDDAGQRFLGGLSFDTTERFHARERTNALLRINELGGQLSEKEFLTTGLELIEKLTHSQIGFLHFVNDDQETLELVTWTGGALKGCTAAYDNHYPVSQAGIWADCLRHKNPVIFNDYASYPHKRGLPYGHTPLMRLISVPIIENDQVRMMLGVGNKASDYSDDDLETLLLLGHDLWRIAQRARLERALQQRVQDLEAANTRLSEMQLQLLQSEKMASLGQLASGVAHEINNPIGFVKSNLGSLATYVSNLIKIVQRYEQIEHLRGDDVTTALTEIAQRKRDMDYEFVVDDVEHLLTESVEGVQRVSKIVLDLKNFSRSGDTAMAAADLQAGIESTINVVWNQLKYKVNLVREFTELPPVTCVASQINQVVLNLLVNAGQAIA